MRKIRTSVIDGLTATRGLALIMFLYGQHEHAAFVPKTLKQAERATRMSWDTCLAQSVRLIVICKTQATN